jgi:hypothetical protein
MKIDTTVEFVMSFVKDHKAFSLIGLSGFSQTDFTMYGGGLEQYRGGMERIVCTPAHVQHPVQEINAII